MIVTKYGLQAETWAELDRLAYRHAYTLNGGRAKPMRPEDIQDVVQASVLRIIERAEKGKIDLENLGHRQALMYDVVRGKVADLMKSHTWAKSNNFTAFAPQDGWETVDECDIQNFELEKVEYRTPADIVADRDYYLNRMDAAVKLVNPAEREVLDSMLKHSADRGKVCAELRITPAQLSRKMFKIREQVNG